MPLGRDAATAYLLIRAARQRAAQAAAGQDRDVEAVEVDAEPEPGTSRTAEWLQERRSRITAGIRSRRRVRMSAREPEDRGRDRREDGGHGLG